MLRNTPPEWNVRVLTRHDFDCYCDSAGILVREMPLDNVPGMYLICDGQPCIFLDEDLRGPDRLFTGFHEYAHYLLHPSRVSFFHGYDDVTEDEADVFAICALIPQTILNHYWPGEIAELYGYPPSLVEFRREVFDRWRI